MTLAASASSDSAAPPPAQLSAWRGLPLKASAPMRADLAGGTLDLWPLYLFHAGAKTLNVALDLRVEVTLETVSDGYRLRSLDGGAETTFSSLAAMAAGPDSPFRLGTEVLRHFGAPPGVVLTTLSPAPRGSGLGASSALAVALIAAVAAGLGRTMPRAAMIALARDLESRVLGKPAGIQDYYPAAYGGSCLLLLEPGDVALRRGVFDCSALDRHLIVVYSGASRFSAENNWEVYRRHLEGDLKIRAAMEGIVGATGHLLDAAAASDWRSVGEAMNEEWRFRCRLSAAIPTTAIDRLMAAALATGAWGGKVCGAGGGGCLIFLAPSGNREAVMRSLAENGGEILPAHPDLRGVVVGPG